jgi:hypothetical protein
LERFMAIAKMQAEQAMHQEQRKQPHSTYTSHASADPQDPTVQYVDVTAH